MSRVGNEGEEVLEVPPLRMATAERLGEAVLEEFEPTALQRPMSLDLGEWVERLLPARGINIYPADDATMPDMEGFTDPDDCTENRSTIVLRESLWDALLYQGSAANRAKATVLHELGHVILHIPFLLRSRQAVLLGASVLRRAAWGQVPAFRNAEWQAWAFAGSVAMPRRTILMLDSINPGEVARVYGVSDAFAASHLKRLKLWGDR